MVMLMLMVVVKGDGDRDDGDCRSSVAFVACVALAGLVTALPPSPSFGCLLTVLSPSPSVGGVYGQSRRLRVGCSPGVVVVVSS